MAQVAIQVQWAPLSKATTMKGDGDAMPRDQVGYCIITPCLISLI